MARPVEDQSSLKMLLCKPHTLLSILHIVIEHGNCDFSVSSRKHMGSSDPNGMACGTEQIGKKANWKSTT